MIKLRTENYKTGHPHLWRPRCLTGHVPQRSDKQSHISLLVQKDKQRFCLCGFSKENTLLVHDCLVINKRHGASFLWMFFQTGFLIPAAGWPIVHVFTGPLHGRALSTSTDLSAERQKRCIILENKSTHSDYGAERDSNSLG